MTDSLISPEPETLTIPPVNDGMDEVARLKIVFVGHVDHGKSTLIGRIFFDTDSLPDGKIENIQKACDAEGMDFEYAFLLDALLEEQEQNITIDTTQIQFRTERRNYVIIDAPGHKEFLKNMVSGASSADAAFLLIAANEGVREQSRRHGYLLSMLGIRQVVVVVNKMDLVDGSKQVFDEIETEYRQFLAQIGLEPKLFIPVSAKNGFNVASRAPAEAGLDWYSGPTILDALDNMQAPPALDHLPLRFPVQDVYRFDHRRIIAGRIETGTLRVGDPIVFSPVNKTTTVASIEDWNHLESRDVAYAGESVGITLTEQIFVERGHVASHVEDSPIETNRFKASVFWMGKQPLKAGGRYHLRLTTEEVACTVTSIERVLDSSTLEATEESRDAVAKNEVAEVVIQTRSPFVVDNHDRVPLMGRFVVMDGHDVAGGGIIYGGVYTDRTKIKSKNITWSEGGITAKNRWEQNGHKGAIIWLTGLSGAGKSTIANALERELFSRRMQVFVLDGDNVRHGLNANLGFSDVDRVENIRRVAEVAKLMAQAGLVVVTAFISPFQIDRRRAREIALEGGCEFHEIYVNAPLAVCEERDPKKLYQKARSGEIRQFTGIDSPYEAPDQAELEIRTDHLSLEESVTRILESLLPSLDVDTEDPGI